MAKRIYFCFHYADVANFRANVVRNHWLLKPDRDAAGFFDWSLWESAEKTGSAAVKRLINAGLEGSSVTSVLIGTDTYLRPWVRYEILKSVLRGNKLFGVHINSIRGKDRLTKPKGLNPFKYIGITFSKSGVTRTLHEVRNGKWQKYRHIGASASFEGTAVAEKYRGNGYNFGLWYPTYDWDEDNGYGNFSKWVG